VLLVVACSPASDGRDAKPVTLHLFTWSAYTEVTVVRQFEERFGVKVVPLPPATSATLARGPVP